MSLGVPLSQIIQGRSERVRSGIKGLDAALNDGFQPQSIYEVYGVPGIGKTKLGVQLMNENCEKTKCLWIDTVEQAPLSLIEDSETCYFTRVKKFTQLWYMFQHLEKSYGLIVIDGFSQLVVEYLRVYEKNSGKRVSLHDFKVKSLIHIFAIMTKYATANNTVIVLLNDAMNTGYQDYSDEAVTSYQGDASSGSFLVKSVKKRHIQVLKSGLIANAAVGGKDGRWEVFLRSRIGLFWVWDPASESKVPDVLRQFVVWKRSSSQPQIVYVKTNERGNFCDGPIAPPVKMASTSTPNTTPNTTPSVRTPSVRTSPPISSTETGKESTAPCTESENESELDSASESSIRKRRRILRAVVRTDPGSTSNSELIKSHSQPPTPTFSQNIIQFTPRIVYSDAPVEFTTPEVSTSSIGSLQTSDDLDIVYNSEG
ncbi:p-loop NTPase superfamily [Kluyveromyces marxianus]